METALVVLLVLEAVVIVVLAVLVGGLLRSHAEILRALHRLGAGEDEAAPVGLRTRPGVPAPRPRSSPAADIAGARPGGGAVKIGVLDTPHPTLLAFLTTGCATCSAFWESFREDIALPGGARLVIVTKGREAESEASVLSVAPPAATTVMSTGAWDHYRVPVAPYFILVDGPTGRVAGEGAAATWRQLLALMERASADAAITGTPRQGRDTEDRAMQDLLAAGIHPGHPSLRPDLAEPGDEGQGSGAGR
jgi:hypothetical protein